MAEVIPPQQHVEFEGPMTLDNLQERLTQRLRDGINNLRKLELGTRATLELATLPRVRPWPAGFGQIYRTTGRMGASDRHDNIEQAIASFVNLALSFCRSEASILRIERLVIHQMYAGVWDFEYEIIIYIRPSEDHEIPAPAEETMEPVL